MDKKRKRSKQLLAVEHSVTDAEHVSNLIFEKKAPIIKPIQSSVLSKVQKFLPQLEAAEKHLKTLSPEDYNIECIAEDSTFIEMNVALLPDESESEDSDIENGQIKIKRLSKNPQISVVSNKENERINDVKS
ncbi:uncharacterized protein [Centruroides vittatus]|uniref:uncharacterized protein n=1 Tax=Centruroides vittatus TaxID=120091 RepID=UPI00350EB29A